MSAVDGFRSDFRAAIESHLKCPKCPAQNRPGATYIELDQTGSRAYCTVCSSEGELVKFMPKEN